MYKKVFFIVVGLCLACSAYGVSAPTAGLIVENPDQLMGFEPQMLDRLESLGYVVEIIKGDDVKDDVFTVADAEALDVIVVSEAISSSDVNRLAGANVPIMHGEGYGWHKMNYAEDGTQGWQDANDLAYVVNDTHPIVANAGLSLGAIDFLLDEKAETTTAQVSVLAPGAVNLVSMVIDGNEYALVFAIDKGAELAKGAGPATNRIVGFSLPGGSQEAGSGKNSTFVLSDAGWALFDAAIAWLNPGPMIAHWPMDDGEGTVVTDVVGGNDGTIVGNVAWIDGILGGAVAFDVNDPNAAIEVPNSDELDFGDVDFSVSMMIRYLTVPGTNQHEFMTKGTTSAPGTGKRYTIFHKGDRMRFEIDNDISKSSLQVSDANFIVIGEWVHLVAVRDSVNDQLLLYADGVLQGTATDTSDDISSGEDMYIGNSPPIYGNNVSPADIDDVRIYSAALTEEDIAEIYGPAPLLVNGSFELPGTDKMDGFNGDKPSYGAYGEYEGNPLPAGPDTNVPGWTTDGETQDCGIQLDDTTDGDWLGFLRGGGLVDQGLWQLTEHVIEADDVIGLSLDAKHNWANEAYTITISIYYDDNGTHVTIASADITMEENLGEQGDWQTYTLTSDVSAVPEAVGKKLGVEIRMSGNYTFAFIDNVVLEVN